MFRELAGTICETLCLLHGDPNAPELGWHYFAASKFGLRGETQKEMVERYKKYAGEDDKSVRNREFFERAKANYEQAICEAMHKQGLVDGEE